MTKLTTYSVAKTLLSIGDQLIANGAPKHVMKKYDELSENIIDTFVSVGDDYFPARLKSFDDLLNGLCADGMLVLNVIHDAQPKLYCYYYNSFQFRTIAFTSLKIPRDLEWLDEANRKLLLSDKVRSGKPKIGEHVFDIDTGKEMLIIRGPTATGMISIDYGEGIRTRSIHQLIRSTKESESKYVYVWKDEKLNERVSTTYPTELMAPGIPRTIRMMTHAQMIEYFNDEGKPVPKNLKATRKPRHKA